MTFNSNYIGIVFLHFGFIFFPSNLQEIMTIVLQFTGNYDNFITASLNLIYIKNINKIENQDFCGMFKNNVLANSFVQGLERKFSQI